MPDKIEEVLKSNETYTNEEEGYAYTISDEHRTQIATALRKEGIGDLSLVLEVYKIVKDTKGTIDIHAVKMRDAIKVVVEKNPNLVEEEL